MQPTGAFGVRGLGLDISGFCFLSPLSGAMLGICARPWRENHDRAEVPQQMLSIRKAYIQHAMVNNATPN